MRHFSSYLLFPSENVKVSPLQAWKPTGGGVDASVHIFTATALRTGRFASRTLGRLYPQESTPVLIQQGVEWKAQGQSGHEGMQKNLHPFESQDRIRVVLPAAKRFAVWFTLPRIFRVILLIQKIQEHTLDSDKTYNSCCKYKVTVQKIREVRDKIDT